MWKTTAVRRGLSHRRAKRSNEKKKIQHLTGTIRLDLDARFVAKPSRTVQMFFPTKDRVTKHLQSNTMCATTNSHSFV